MKTQPKPTTISKSARAHAPTHGYCVCCERPLNPKSLPVHHEGNEKKEVPMCAKCHWAMHYGNLEVRKTMKKKVHAWLKKQQK